jgi:site-specific DNA-cytosine methylase
MKVLSLFDGISAGQLALQRAGIAVDAYYASEVDKYAISVTQKNFPNTIQLGDVTKWREWDIPWGEIDLVIGGSPCQGFSFAGKQLNFDDPRSALFFVFVDICHRVADDNPKMKFMLENVRMKKEYQDVISGYFGVQPIPINSSLVSAQNRYRLYWTNIPNVTQPDDRGILLRDIILDDVDNKYYLSAEAIDYMGRLRNGKERWEYHKNNLDGKSACLTANMHKGVPYGVLRITGARQTGRYLVDGKRADHTVDSMKGLTEQRIEFRKDGKSNCLTSVQKDSLVGALIATGNSRLDQTLTKHVDNIDQPLITDSYNKTIHKNKSMTITARVGGSCMYHVVDSMSFRKLNPIECERLQTFPDNWTEGISDTQRYKALGNSWTVDVVTHIFKNL